MSSTVAAAYSLAGGKVSQRSVQDNTNYMSHTFLNKSSCISPSSTYLRSNQNLCYTAAGVAIASRVTTVDNQQLTRTSQLQGNLVVYAAATVFGDEQPVASYVLNVNAGNHGRVRQRRSSSPCGCLNCNTMWMLRLQHMAAH